MSKQRIGPGGFVLDGSICLAWYFKDEANPYADAVAARFPDVKAIVPAIWPLELANAVLGGERRKRSTEACFFTVTLTCENKCAKRLGIGDGGQGGADG
jgi:hypothetical protein